MPEQSTRDQRVLYDHEHDAGPRRRQADDWGIDESFPRVRGRRFSRAQGATSRNRLHPVEDISVEDPAEEIAVEDEAPVLVEADERRTIRINGRPGEVSEIAPFTSTARRRRPPLTVEERLAGDPTRIIAWAVALGMLLIVIAILTA